MKKMIVFFVFIALAVVAVFAETYRCQLDNGTMYFTGKTKTEWGKLAKEYKCPAGHSYWVVDNNSSSQNSNPYDRSPKCQYDNMSLRFTGETKTEYGKLLKKYVCPSNHVYWLTN